MLNQLKRFKSLSESDKTVLAWNLFQGPPLLSSGVSNAKTIKKLKGYTFKNYILYLSPANISGLNLCPMASEGCKKACLYTAGRGVMRLVQDARLKRTLYFRYIKDSFKLKLLKEVEKINRQATKTKTKAVIRLNGTSDLQWENIKVKDDKSLMDLFPNIQFYDYTKIARRFTKPLPKNYYLLLSSSETNEKDCFEVLKQGFNVAMVFRQVPKTYKSFNVIDGDRHDFRFKDPKGYIIGLTAKGRAKKDTSGFVK